MASSDERASTYSSPDLDYDDGTIDPEVLNYYRPAMSTTRSNSSSLSGSSLRAVDLMPLLREKIVMVPGGRDRRGGPLMCFPANSHADRVRPEDLHCMIRYLSYLPDEAVRKMGFAVLVDLRGNNKGPFLKFVIRALEDSIPQSVEMLFAVKPDKMSDYKYTKYQSSKCNFDIQVITYTQLYQYVDSSQLTTDFEGSMPFNVDEWILIRCRLEEYFMLAHDMSEKFTKLYRILDRKDHPDSVVEAKSRLEDFRSVRLKVVQAPVHMLEAEADRISHWLRYGVQNSQSAYLGTSWVCMNPDFQQVAPRVKQRVTQLYEYRALLQQKWESVRSRLEQVYQLRLFEEDTERMSLWLAQQRHLFLTEYLDIGNSNAQANELYSEHQCFLNNCSNVRQQVGRLKSVSNKLADSGHFASQQILMRATQLEHEWKSFATALEDRSHVLHLSGCFHLRADTYLQSCGRWERTMRELEANSVQELQEALTTLQETWKDIQKAYSDVCFSGKALLDHLQTPVPSGSHTSLTAAVDYSEGRNHCINLVHDLLSWNKRLEMVYGERKKRLSARLSTLMFKEDVSQVLAWLNQHGEPFLARQTAVGRTNNRAEQLYNAHMQFEQVASTTLSNAEKLVAAADDLATQALDPEEILQDATELQRRITGFTSAMVERRELLDLACAFYSHMKELLDWMASARNLYSPDEMLPPSIEGVEEALLTFHSQRESLLTAAARDMEDGEALLGLVVEEEERIHLRDLLAKMDEERVMMEEFLSEHQLRLDLCLQLRLYEADVASATDGLHANDITAVTAAFDNVDLDLAVLDAEHASFTTSVVTAEEVLQKGNELSVAFESVGVNFPSGELQAANGEVEIEMSTSRITRLSTELYDLTLIVDECRMRIANEIEWRRLNNDTRQVIQLIRNGEKMLLATTTIPDNLNQAQQLAQDHAQFQKTLEHYHPLAMDCATRAESILKLSVTGDRPDSIRSWKSQLEMSRSGRRVRPYLPPPPVPEVAGETHHRLMSAHSKLEEITSSWQFLVYQAEERHKLLVTSINWYKTVSSVSSVLQNLEKEFRAEEDWCHAYRQHQQHNHHQQQQHQQESPQGSSVEHPEVQLNKLIERKESFVQACILARKGAENFLKYLNRLPIGTPRLDSVKNKVHHSTGDMMTQQEAVLEAWTAKKRRLDQCLQFVNLEADTEQVLSRFNAESANSPAKAELRERMRVLCSLVDTLEGHYHATGIRALMNRLQAAAAAYDGATGGARARGGKGGAVMPLTVSLASVVGGPEEGLSEEAEKKRKAARRRELILNELIQTERAYVQDLAVCLTQYRERMINPLSDMPVPPGLIGKDELIFGNMTDVFEFHNEVFLKELEKYTGSILAEDVGHCFVTHGDRLASLYVAYCVNHPASQQLLIHEAGVFFDQLMQSADVPGTVQSYLIKPVQRITKYQLLLKELLDCCEPASAREIREGLDAMLAVPKKANDALHLSLLEGLPQEDLGALGEVILQEQFTVWEPKQLIKKGRERHVFLFDLCLLLAKEMSSSGGGGGDGGDGGGGGGGSSGGGGGGGKVYQYKSRILLAECNITEHIEGDQCKFALWTGRVPISDGYRLILRASNLDTKQAWVRAMREAMQERMFPPVGSLYDRSAPPKAVSAGNTTTGEMLLVADEFKASTEGELSVSVGQSVELVDQNADWALVRVTGAAGASVEGRVPLSVLRKKEVGSAGPGAAGASRERRGSSVKRWLTSGGGQKAGKRGTGVTTKEQQQASRKPHGKPKQQQQQQLQQLQQQQIQQQQQQNALDERQRGPGQEGHAMTPQVAGQLLDNVSEDSVEEVELPPPMEELQSAGLLDAEKEEYSSEQTTESPPVNDDVKQDLPSGDVGQVPRASQEALDPGRALVEGLANCENAAAQAGRVMAPVPPPPPPPASRTLSEEMASQLRARKDSDRTLAETEEEGASVVGVGGVMMPQFASSAAEWARLELDDRCVTPNGAPADGDNKQKSPSENGGGDGANGGGGGDTIPPKHSDSGFSSSSAGGGGAGGGDGSSTQGGASGGAGGDEEENNQPPPTSPTASESDDTDERTRLLKCRLQPLQELVDSEKSYVKRLTFVKEKYIPALEVGSTEIPEDLASKWRIVWGNWAQLHEWHAAFLEKLERCNANDPDDIPNLFVDCRSRLRFIYAKYCENYRKAALIAETHRQTFEELRIAVKDKEDVASHLMQPVQRIMRYQLPMGEIVKLSERADLPSAIHWRSALEIMREIPKDAQHILEAARIDGYGGKITALGNIRIRGDLMLAVLPRSELETSGPQDVRFMERRVFLFDQMLLITEEIKSKRRDTPFAQSSYCFRHAVNVNRMNFVPHWPTAPCSPGGAGDSCGSEGGSSLEFAFAVVDISPDAKSAFVMDPGSRANRDPWVVQLHDMQNMQKQFLLALQDPKRFSSSGSSESAIGSAGTDLCCGGSGASSPGCTSTASTSTVGSSGKMGSLSRGNSANRVQHRARTEDLSSALLQQQGSNIPVRKDSCPNAVVHGVRNQELKKATPSSSPGEPECPDSPVLPQHPKKKSSIFNIFSGSGGSGGSKGRSGGKLSKHASQDHS